MGKSCKLRPTQRLRSNVDFSNIRQKGKPYRCPYFALHSIIRASSSSADSLHSRIGISASRRVGNAVERNQAKRRIREIYRTFQHRILPEADLVFSLRAPIKNASFEEIEQRFKHAIKYNGVRVQKQKKEESD